VHNFDKLYSINEIKTFIVLKMTFQGAQNIIKVK